MTHWSASFDPHEHLTLLYFLLHEARIADSYTADVDQIPEDPDMFDGMLFHSAIHLQLQQPRRRRRENKR
jgi:hypothetical protein